MSRCHLCSRLSISRLIDLASTKVVRSDGIFGYPHHSSIKDLQLSANAGCDLCTLILHRFGDTVASQTSYPRSHNQHSQTPSRPANPVLGPARPLGGSDIQFYASIDTLVDPSQPGYSSVLQAIHIDIRPSYSELTEVVLPTTTLTFTLSTPHGEFNVANNARSKHTRTDHYQEEPIYINDIRVGRIPRDPVLSSQSNFNIARDWVHFCHSEHISCLENYNPILPTRVIDVEALRIVSLPGQVAPYVTLSHCWGGRVSPLLRHENCDLFERSIPLGLLPPNFRDAITITRNLGVRYLWIDALCILQDSKQDWDNEIKQVAAYFSNSYFTIFGMASQSSHNGLFGRPQTQMPINPVYLPLSHNVKDDCQVALAYDPSYDELRNLSQDGPLASRAWTLQESMLATRQLHYGKHQIYWKCHDGYRFADGCPSPDRLPVVKHPTIQSLCQGLSPDTAVIPPSRDTVLHEYYSLVEEYCSKLLTRDSDKLPAFSALAENIHRYLGGYYLSGLWDFDFPKGLAWWSETFDARRNPEYHAPSWSWAATNSRIRYVTDKFREDMFKLEQVKWGIILSDPNNPYGEIKEGYTLARGFTTSLIRSTQVVDTYASTPVIGLCRFDDVVEPSDSDAEPTTRLYRMNGNSNYILSVQARSIDEKDWEIDPDKFMLESYILLVLGTCEEDLEHLPTRAHCLILRPSPGTPRSDGQEYQRIGLATLSNLDLDWVAKWDLRTVKLI
ncbi:heterokaryon incompatibility protein-domain-containing protein [Xylariaceae sp. FL1019]|nr:heterokaryon incompatibility protein-domain-containing protein [Xylariaceae sp. FL1019]